MNFKALYESICEDYMSEALNGSWSVKWSDDESDDVNTATFKSKIEADDWIKSKTQQSRYEHDGFEVIEDPFQMKNVNETEENNDSPKSKDAQEQNDAADFFNEEDRSEEFFETDTSDSQEDNPASFFGEGDDLAIIDDNELDEEDLLEEALPKSIPAKNVFLGEEDF